MVRMRIKYRKVGAIRFVSHRDVMRILRRAMAAGEVPVCFSQGFNPHPRFSFGPSLRTGWESEGEYLDASLEEATTTLADRCRAQLPEGLEIVETAVVDPSVPKLSTDVCAAAYRVYIDGENYDEKDLLIWNEVFENVAHTPDGTGFGHAHATAVEKAIRRTTPCKTAAGPTDGVASVGLLELTVSEKDGDLCIEYLSTMREGKSLFPEEILQPLVGDPSQLPVPPRVVRRDLFAGRDGDLVSPIESRVVNPLGRS